MVLDLFLMTAGGICVIAGIIGCVLPVIPGPLLSYAGLLIFQFSSMRPFTVELLLVYAVLTAVVAVLDYLIPVYGTKKLQGSKYGIWGSTAGLVAGMFFFFPVGIIVGPVLGAFLGELISGKTKERAFKSALGSFLGFLAGTTLKLALSVSMAAYYVVMSYESFAGP